jgi:hypothetical protein
LYRAEKAKPSPDPGLLARLKDVVKNYRLSLKPGIKFGPDTTAGRDVITRAERGAEGRAAIVAHSELIALPVAATAAQVS